MAAANAIWQIPAKTARPDGPQRKRGLGQLPLQTLEFFLGVHQSRHGNDGRIIDDCNAAGPGITGELLDAVNSVDVFLDLVQIFLTGEQWGTDPEPAGEKAFNLHVTDLSSLRG